MKTKENYTIYTFKTLATFAVVNLHIPLPGDPIFGLLARFAVPFFFMVSGFFYEKGSAEKEVQSAKKNIIKLLLLALLSLAVYQVLYGFKASHFNPISAQLNDPRGQWRFWLFNYTGDLFGDAVYHLWYLFALVYVYIIYGLVSKFNLKKYLLMLAPLIFILSFLLDIYYPDNEKLFLHRNFLGTGLPFFSLGLLIKQWSDKIAQIRLTLWHYLVWVGFLLSLLLLEGQFIPTELEIYPSSILLATSCLIYSILYPFKLKLSPFYLIGQYHFTNIYIFHRYFITLVRTGFSDQFVQVWGTVTVFLLSLAGSLVYEKIKQSKAN